MLLRVARKSPEEHDLIDFFLLLRKDAFPGESIEFGTETPNSKCKGS